MKIECYSKKRRKMKNLILYGITVTADITLMVCLLSVSSLIGKPMWWVAIILSVLWIALFRIANWDRW